ncbi:MAG: signal peptidase I [Lachnospiraceae bacterium]
MKKVINRIVCVLGNLFTILLVAVLCVNVYLGVARVVFNNPCPSIFGFSWAVVVSGSMSGSIEVNDVVIIHRQDDYRAEDVITFQSGSSLVTHRISEVTDSGYVTKGDANNSEDPEPAEPESVVGKVVFIIPKIGALIQFFTSPAGMAVLFVIAVLLLLMPFPEKKNKHPDEVMGGVTDEK